VTVEDIVEELVGEIKDEYDVEGDPLVVEPDGSVVADGRASVERLEQALETELSIGEEIDTVGGSSPRSSPGSPARETGRATAGSRSRLLAAEKKRVNRVRFRRVTVETPGVNVVVPFRAGS